MNVVETALLHGINSQSMTQVHVSVFLCFCSDLLPRDPSIQSIARNNTLRSLERAFCQALSGAALSDATALSSLCPLG